MTMQTEQDERIRDITIEEQLKWHLVSNHFPPIAPSMVRACIEAIDACNAYNHTKLISLPDRVGYKGLTAASAGEIAGTCDLDQWIVQA